MNRLLLATLVSLAVLIAIPARAGIYHTRGNNDSLLYANANAVAGDVVYVEAGTYTAPIAPEHSGTSGARITYLGNKAAPTAATVAGIWPAYNPDSHNYVGRGDYVTVKWVASSASIGCGYYLRTGEGWVVSRNDSLVKIVAAGGLNMLTRYSVFDSLTCTGSNSATLDANMDLQEYPPDERFLRPAGNVVKNSTFNATVSSSCPAVQIFHMVKTSYNTFWKNTFNVTVNGGTDYFFVLEFYRSYFNVVQDNVFNVTMNVRPAGTCALLGYRDSTSHCRFVRNVFNVSGPGQIDLGLSQSGSLGGSTRNNCFEGNTFKIQNCLKGGMFVQNGLRGDTIQFNVVRVGNSAPAFTLDGPDSLTNSVIRHNTFYTTGPTVAVAIAAGHPVPGTNNRWVSNIAYVRNGTPNGSVALLPTHLAIDSAGVFYAPPPARSVMAIQLGATLGAPGSGAGFGAATTSLWGDPAFVDPSPTTFDPRLQPGSAALTATLTDGYAGAVADTNAAHPTSWSVASDSALSVAMAGAKPGDVVTLSHGTYSAGLFVPAASGNASGLVRIVGDVAHADSVKLVGNAVVTATRLAISGVTFKGQTTFAYASGDSIKNCVFASNGVYALAFSNGPDSLVFRSNTVYCAGTNGAILWGSNPTNSAIRGNVFIARPYAGCTSAGFLRGAALLVTSSAPFNSDSNYFAASTLTKHAGLLGNHECWGFADWQNKTSNDAHSIAALFSGSLFKDARWASLDLRPSAHSSLYTSKAPGGHYGALAKP